MPVSDTVVDALVSALGADAVDRSPASLAASSHDTWPLSTKQAMVGQHPYAADVVVSPTSFDDIPKILAIASQHGVPVTVRALASSVTGQPLPVRGGIVLAVAQIPATYSVNEQNMTVTATASLNGGYLEDELAARGFTLGHSPQSLKRSTVGGWVATLATGQFSSMYGGIEDLVTGYTVILATGETIELKASPRAAMGPDLRRVFIGAEGTLGVVTSVTLKIFPADLPTQFATFSMPSVHAGLQVMRQQALAGLRPYLLRFYDEDEARHALKDPTVNTPVFFLGTRGPQNIADAEMEFLRQLCTQAGGQELDVDGAQQWMGRRFDFSSVENQLAQPGGFAETIEVAHNWDGIESLYQALRSALLPFADEVLSHFSHVYTQGTSMYVILFGKTDTDEEAITRLETMWKTAMDVCLEHGAELSHHHGGGLVRSPYSRRSLGSAHMVLEKLKHALDPADILNPGKLGL